MTTGLAFSVQPFVQVVMKVTLTKSYHSYGGLLSRHQQVGIYSTCQNKTTVPYILQAHEVPVHCHFRCSTTTLHKRFIEDVTPEAEFWLLSGQKKGKKRQDVSPFRKQILGIVTKILVPYLFDSYASHARMRSVSTYVRPHIFDNYFSLIIHLNINCYANQQDIRC